MRAPILALEEAMDTAMSTEFPAAMVAATMAVDIDTV
jgi:hypothetical protein